MILFRTGIKQSSSRIHDTLNCFVNATQEAVDKIWKVVFSDEEHEHPTNHLISIKDKGNKIAVHISDKIQMVRKERVKFRVLQVHSKTTDNIYLTLISASKTMFHDEYSY